MQFHPNLFFNRYFAARNKQVRIMTTLELNAQIWRGMVRKPAAEGESLYPG